MKMTLNRILRAIGAKPYIQLYARPDGSHAHADLNCIMLTGDQFKRLGYREISISEAERGKLVPCECLRKKVE